MKNKQIEWIILIFTAFCVIGCSTAKLKPVPYDFTENEKTNGKATLFFGTAYYNSDNFGGYCGFVDLEGKKLPKPEKGTYWNLIQVPAGKELNIRVYISFQGKYSSFGKYQDGRRMGIFRCPPLEAGKKYKLWFESYEGWYGGKKEIGELGAGRLILTYANVKKLNSFTKKIYVQEIPPLVL